MFGDNSSFSEEFDEPSVVDDEEDDEEAEKKKKSVLFSRALPRCLI